MNYYAPIPPGLQVFWGLLIVLYVALMALSLVNSLPRRNWAGYTTIAVAALGIVGTVAWFIYWTVQTIHERSALRSGEFDNYVDYARAADSSMENIVYTLPFVVVAVALLSMLSIQIKRRQQIRELSERLDGITRRIADTETIIDVESRDVDTDRCNADND